MQNMLKAGILPLSKRESGKRRRRELLRLVRQALAGDSFELYYQPVYDCERRQFRSAEGLIRLRDENGGLVSPGEFIPLAEGAGLMGENQPAGAGKGGFFPGAPSCRFFRAAFRQSLSRRAGGRKVFGLDVEAIGASPCAGQAASD